MLHLNITHLGELRNLHELVRKLCRSPQLLPHLRRLSSFGTRYLESVGHKQRRGATPWNNQALMEDLQYILPRWEVVRDIVYSMKPHHTAHPLLYWYVFLPMSTDGDEEAKYQVRCGNLVGHAAAVQGRWAGALLLLQRRVEPTLAAQFLKNFTLVPPADKSTRSSDPRAMPAMLLKQAVRIATSRASGTRCHVVGE